MSINPESTNPTGVFLWARSGGGHRTAKEGIKQQKIKEYAASGKNLDTSTDIDITGEKVLSAVRLPFVGGLGDIGVRSWDNAQKKGDLKFLENYASWGWIGEILFYPIVYFKMKSILQNLKVEPDFVVSTQAFCLNAIVQAMRSVNKEKSWKMHMHVHLTDMPSKKAIHFFPSINKVAKNDDLRDMVTLHAPKPLTKANESDADFWKKYCGKINVITDKNFPLREAFLETSALKKRLEQPVIDVNIKLNRPEEAAIIKKGLAEASASSFDEGRATIKVKKEDKLAFLMLGSMPTTKSVLDWVNSFAEESQNSSVSDAQRYFFLYCGAPNTDQEQNPLLKAVSEEIDKLKIEGKIARNFNLIPFTNQSADEIALLMARSDVSITRSGGATSMELLQLDKADLPKRANKATLIHSEASLILKQDAPKQNRNWIENIIRSVKKWLGLAPSTKKQIAAQIKKMEPKEAYNALDATALRKLAIERILTRKGIVLWEGGNAKYLANKIGAHVTNPYWAKSYLKDSFF